MWKPSVNAICSRAASRFDADAASGSGVERGTADAYSPRAGAAVAADQRVGRAVVARASAPRSACSSGMIATASALPSSTPHWSKESIPQIAPWVKTLCS